MDGIVALDAVLLVLVVVVIAVKLGRRRLLAGWTWVVRGPVEPVRVPAPRLPHAAERVESAFAAGVVGGLVTGRDYQRRMAELAAADALRRPLVVPRR